MCCGFSTLQCKTMVTILLQYVNKQIKEKIQGLQIFDRNSHIVQLLYVCYRENCLSNFRCCGNQRFVYTRRECWFQYIGDLRLTLITLLESKSNISWNYSSMIIYRWQEYFDSFTHLITCYILNVVQHVGILFFEL